MDRDCREFRDRLVELAEGQAAPEVAAHVAGCGACAELVERYRSILDAGQFPWQDAPSALIQRAKAIMPQRAPRARLLGTSLVAGARAATEDFQVVVGDDHRSVRMMVNRTQDGWELMGRLPEDGWTVETDLRSEIEGEGFRIFAPSLDRSAFRLTSPEASLDVPPLAELLENDRG